MSTGKIFFCAGELSGDEHGGRLLAALKRQDPSLAAPGRLLGMGGEAMAAEGQLQTAHVRELSVMGVTEVLAALPRILKLLNRLKKALKEQRPDLLVCIDAPSFNFQLIRAATKLGIPTVYYISPKIWAWHTSRVQFIKKHVRRVLCILPFEVDFYAEHGVAVDYIGNPTATTLDYPTLDALPAEPELLGLLPGSRKRELAELMPLFGQAARLLQAERPGLRVAALRAPSLDEAQMRALWPGGPGGPELEIIPPPATLLEKYAAMRRFCAVLAASGTVTLETALLKVPTVAAYRVSPLSGFLMRRAIRVPYVSLANLILTSAGRNTDAAQVIPELLQERCTPESLAAQALPLLAESAERRAQLAGFERLRALLGQEDVPANAARIILQEFSQRV